MSRLRPLACLAFSLIFVGCPDPGKGDSAGGSSSGAATDATATAATTGAATTGAATEATTSDATATGTPTTGAGTTGGPLAPECQQDSDCMLVNNCCECRARPVGAEIPDCPGNCRQPTCDAMQLDGIVVACRSGVCEFANVQCSSGPANCGEPIPTCPPNTQTSIVGDCWGPCVPERYCDGRTCSGASCGDGWMCVQHQATSSECVPIPHECDGTPTCSCVAPYFDEFCFGGCSEAGGSLLCEDGG